MIGLGIVTYNRPEYFKESIAGVIEHLLDVCDHIFVYNDGSTEEYDYSGLPDKITVHHAKENKGVAVAKNWLLKAMMDAGCQYLFIAEDDIVPIDRGAIVNYIALSRVTGNHHLLFAHHGDGNSRGPIYDGGNFHVYTNCVGAWNYYSRAAIEKAGYMDENFHNAWEHVEHSHRISKEGLTTPFGHYMDLADSTEYLQEIPESIENSSIRQDDKWRQRMLEGLYYWKKKDPKDFPLQHTIDELERGVW